MSESKTGVKGQGLRYLLVGCTSALVELSCFQLLYGVVDLDVAFSNIIAIGLSALYNFLLNRSFTFKNSGSPLRAMVLYVLLFFFNTVFTTWSIALLIDFGVFPLLAKFGTMCCVTIWNFILYRTVIFK